jgi:hypothetical protein
MAHDPGKENKRMGFQKEAVDAWGKQFPDRAYQDFVLRDFPEDKIHWIEGPDTITATVLGRCETTRGVFVSVTPEDNAIEVDRVARVKLDAEFQCLDGEMSLGKPIGRIIGLFEMEALKKNMNSHEFLPERLFFEGLERNPKAFRSVLDEYRGQCGKPPVAQDAEILTDLCPITRVLLTRFFSLPCL